MKDKPSNRQTENTLQFCRVLIILQNVYCIWGHRILFRNIQICNTAFRTQTVSTSSGKRARKLGPEIVCLSGIGVILPFHLRTEIVCLRNRMLIFAFLQTRWWTSRSLWPRGLRRGFAAARLLGLRFRIPPEEWMIFSCECCLLSRRGLYIGLITRPEVSYRVCCVFVWSWSPDTGDMLDEVFGVVM